MRTRNGVIIDTSDTIDDARAVGGPVFQALKTKASWEGRSGARHSAKQARCRNQLHILNLNHTSHLHPSLLATSTRSTRSTRPRCATGLKNSRYAASMSVSGNGKPFYSGGNALQSYQRLHRRCEINFETKLMHTSRRTGQRWLLHFVVIDRTHYHRLRLYHGPKSRIWMDWNGTGIGNKLLRVDFACFRRFRRQISS